MSLPVPSYSKLQQRTLAHLRAILRHARDNFVASAELEPPGAAPAPPLGAGKRSRLFSDFVLARYRASRGVADRTRLRELRELGADVAAYLRAQAAQAELLRAHRGFDPDRPIQRHAAARYVGLEMPRVAATGEAAAAAAAPRSAEQLSERYVDGLRERTAPGADAASRLTGIENMKAQYFGVPVAPAIAKVVAQQSPPSDADKGASGGASGDAKLA